jgi:hypothetical protein
MKKYLVLFGFVFCSLATRAQTTALPYYEIPEAPSNYDGPNVAARMIDGLGFRYYWATEGLRTEDLAYKPSNEARTCEATIDHILELTEVILNSVKKLSNDGSATSEDLTFAEKRALTLNNLQQASDILKNSSPSDLKDYKIVFATPTRTTEYPFWNQINGPIADALWHTGQVVSFRRASGNPFNSKVSVLSGKVLE